MAGKYDPLRAYLVTMPGEEVCYTFAEVEAIIGAPLPPTALRHTAWWANSCRFDHPQARAWMAGGWTAGVDLDNTCVTFFRRETQPTTPRRYHLHTPRPTQYPHKLSVAVSRRLKNAIDDAAVDQEMTTSDLMRTILIEWLARHEKERRKVRKRNGAPHTYRSRVTMSHG